MRNMRRGKSAKTDHAKAADLAGLQRIRPVRQSPVDQHSDCCNIAARGSISLRDNARLHPDVRPKGRRFFLNDIIVRCPPDQAYRKPGKTDRLKNRTFPIRNRGFCSPAGRFNRLRGDHWLESFDRLLHQHRSIRLAHCHASPLARHHALMCAPVGVGHRRRLRSAASCSMRSTVPLHNQGRPT